MNRESSVIGTLFSFSPSVCIALRAYVDIHVKLSAYFSVCAACIC